MAIFADVVEEWKKASPKEKLLIGGVSVGAIGLALYLHSKSTSAVAGTGTAGLPSSFQPANDGGSTGTGTPTPPTGPTNPGPVKKPPPPPPVKKPPPPPPKNPGSVYTGGPFKPAVGSYISKPNTTPPTPPPLVKPGYTGVTGPPPSSTAPLVKPGYTGVSGPPGYEQGPAPVLTKFKPYIKQQPTITANVAARINHPAALQPLAAHHVPTGYYALPAVPQPGVPKPAPIPQPPTRMRGPF